MRYVDLIVNPAARQLAELRASVPRAIREELHRQGYIEAETPMLQTLHGGANARPFVTHINAYDMPLYLRIALELYLKRLMVGGFEKIYELGRNFRNEGADATHNPEFTMLEAYQAYGDYTSIGVLTRDLIIRAAQEGLGGTVIRRHDGAEYDIGGGGPSVTVHHPVSAAPRARGTPHTREDPPRKLPAHAGVPAEPPSHPAHRPHGHGHGPCPDHAHGRIDQGDDPVPDRPPHLITVASGPSAPRQAIRTAPS